MKTPPRKDDEETLDLFDDPTFLLECFRVESMMSEEEIPEIGIEFLEDEEPSPPQNGATILESLKRIEAAEKARRFERQYQDDIQHAITRSLEDAERKKNHDTRNQARRGLKKKREKNVAREIFLDVGEMNAPVGVPGVECCSKKDEVLDDGCEEGKNGPVQSLGNQVQVATQIVVGQEEVVRNKVADPILQLNDDVVPVAVVVQVVSAPVVVEIVNRKQHRKEDDYGFPHEVLHKGKWILCKVLRKDDSHYSELGIAENFDEINFKEMDPDFTREFFSEEEAEEDQAEVDASCEVICSDSDDAMLEDEMDVVIPSSISPKDPAYQNDEIEEENPTLRDPFVYDVDDSTYSTSSDHSTTTSEPEPDSPWHTSESGEDIGFDDGYEVFIPMDPSKKSEIGYSSRTNLLGVKERSEKKVWNDED